MYRIKSTGEIKSQGEVRRLFPNVSLPRVWDEGVCTYLGIDPVLESPAPTITRYQTANKSGVIQDANGNWVWNWVIGPTFTEYTDEEDVTHSVADQTVAYRASIDNTQAALVRSSRDQKLKESDWTQGKDISDEVSTAWATYRQSLRDVPEQEGFPWDVTWPDQPE